MEQEQLLGLMGTEAQLKVSLICRTTWIITQKVEKMQESNFEVQVLAERIEMNLG
jgi:hypothetical protein